MDYARFESLYTIIWFNLSHHKPYIDLRNLMIEFHWKLKSLTAYQYVFYFVLLDTKCSQLKMVDKQLKIIKEGRHGDYILTLNFL